MKITQLEIELENLNIPKSLYNLEGSISNVGTVLYRNYDKWEVIHVGDKGEQKIAAIFSTEDEACQFILNEFIEYKNVFSKDFKPKKSKVIKNLDSPPDVINL